MQITCHLNGTNTSYAQHRLEMGRSRSDIYIYIYKQVDFTTSDCFLITVMFSAEHLLTQRTSLFLSTSATIHGGENSSAYKQVSQNKTIGKYHQTANLTTYPQQNKEAEN